jgi:hypothetical protein
MGTKEGGVHKIIIFYLYYDLFSSRDGRISILPSCCCSGDIDESSFYISPDEMNANFEDGGTSLEIMHFWYWVILRPSIGKGIMIMNAESNATTG